MPVGSLVAETAAKIEELLVKGSVATMAIQRLF